MMSNTLHIIGVPHTIANDDFLVCAFTSKVYLFPDVIIPFGWYVIEYSNEGSQSAAHEHIVILSHQRYQQLTRRISRNDGHHLDLDNEEMNKEFKERTIIELRNRAKPGDIICHIWGPDIEIYDATPDCFHVELSVGYGATPGLPFRIFESSAWMHYHYGMVGKDEDGSNYKWVIPSAFDEDKWAFSEKKQDYVLFHGRVTARKGISIIVEIARRMPDLQFYIHGPGEADAWLEERPDNLHFGEQLFGDARVEKVQGAKCVLTPTMYIEPFGFSGIEAQLCGVPQIGSCFGAFHETIIEGVTGFRCHTLADWVHAIRKSESLDRARIAQLARQRYARSSVGRQYDQALRQISDLAKEGWYGATSRKFDCERNEVERYTSKIWLYIPYFGNFPNYFSLYLKSLALNSDRITIIVLTDQDLTDFDIPRNLILIPMTLEALRVKIAKFINDTFEIEVDGASLVQDPYKLVDFKPIFPDLFSQIGVSLNIQENDYVGWGDIDVIYGRFDRFLDLERDYEVVGGFHGHLTAFRYSGFARHVYKAIPGLLDLLLSPKIELVDEMVIRDPLMSALKDQGADLFYANRYFCDVVPDCFVSKFREVQNFEARQFFDAYHPNDEIECIKKDVKGHLVVHYRDGTRRETLYCHLQKRAMTINVEESASDYVIRHDGFYKC